MSFVFVSLHFLCVCGSPSISTLLFCEEHIVYSHVDVTLPGSSWQVRLLDKSTASANSFGKGSSMKFDVLISTPLRLVRVLSPVSKKMCVVVKVPCALDSCVRMRHTHTHTHTYSLTHTARHTHTHTHSLTHTARDIGVHHVYACDTHTHTHTHIHTHILTLSHTRREILIKATMTQTRIIISLQKILFADTESVAQTRTPSLDHAYSSCETPHSVFIFSFFLPGTHAYTY